MLHGGEIMRMNLQHLLMILISAIRERKSPIMSQNPYTLSSWYSLKSTRCVIGSNNAMYLIIALCIQGVKSLCNETNG